MTTELKQAIASLKPENQDRTCKDVKLPHNIDAMFCAEYKDTEGLILDLETMEVVKYEDDAEGHEFVVISCGFARFHREDYW